MALFTKKTTVKAVSTKTKAVKKTKDKVITAEIVKTEAVIATVQNSGKGLDISQVILRPHITEKASDLSERGVYAFEISKLANKAQVLLAVQALFKVKPVKIAIVNQSPKYTKNPRTNRVQVKKQAIKKAFVYLKKGDKIEFV